METKALYIRYNEQDTDASYSPVDNTPLKQNLTGFCL